ncbi:hypothetical protein E6C76_04750 [Pseudothauera nasutitermitis]|uniref:Lipoprotein n=1 Tax=Pseudothauera nasutitermitis TaxID=2565930 RepID=A0A4S4B0V3_9RHOO|nr:DUF6491 family protein [Pseudothauera nasutitermitis]THF66171.1 hypothetical protein E6C76_04750 [Pseudothauera nasutitermitis]
MKPSGRTRIDRPWGVALLFALLSACASVDKAPEPETDWRQTLEKRGYRQGEAVRMVPSFSLSGWNYIDEYHIQVDDGPGRDYLITFSIPCRELQWVERIGYTTSAGTFGVMERILARHVGQPVSCPVSELHRLERVERSSSGGS